MHILLLCGFAIILCELVVSLTLLSYLSITVLCPAIKRIFKSNKTPQSDNLSRRCSPFLQ